MDTGDNNAQSPPDAASRQALQVDVARDWCSRRRQPPVSLLPGFSNFMSESTEPRQVLEELTRTRRMMLLFRGIS